MRQAYLSMFNYPQLSMDQHTSHQPPELAEQSDRDSVGTSASNVSQSLDNIDYEGLMQELWVLQRTDDNTRLLRLTTSDEMTNQAWRGQFGQSDFPLTGGSNAEDSLAWFPQYLGEVVYTGNPVDGRHRIKSCSIATKNRDRARQTYTVDCEDCTSKAESITVTPGEYCDNWNRKRCQ